MKYTFKELCDMPGDAGLEIISKMSITERQEVMDSVSKKEQQLLTENLKNANLGKKSNHLQQLNEGCSA